MVTVYQTGSRRVHILGAGGVGLSGLALLMAGAGFSVTGSDARDSPIVGRVRDAGIPVTIGTDPDSAAAADWLVKPAHVRADHPEVQAALRAGVRVLIREQALVMMLKEELLDPDQTLLVTGPVFRSASTLGLAALAGQSAGWLAGALPANQEQSHAHAGHPLIIEWDSRRPVPARLVSGIIVSDAPEDDFGYHKEPSWLHNIVRASEAAGIPCLYPESDDGENIVFRLSGRGRNRKGADSGEPSGGGSARGEEIDVLLSPADHAEPGLRKWRVMATDLRGSISLVVDNPALGRALAPALTWGMERDMLAPDASGSLRPSGQWQRFRKARLAIHDVRTHPVAIAALLDLLVRSIGERPGAVLRPWHATFDAYPLETLVRAFSAAGSVYLLPPYPGESPDAHNVLAEAIRAAGGDAFAIQDSDPLLTSADEYGAWLVLGGDDMVSIAAELAAFEP